MKIATWNINSVRVRFEQLCTFLKENSIDIMLLQELKCIEPLFPYDIFEDLGYTCEIFGQKAYNGVAILSKYRIEDVNLGDKVLLNDEDARYIEAFVCGHMVASVYVPNGRAVNLPAYQHKLEFLDALYDHLRKRSKLDSYVIGGDFNIARSDDDVYDPEAWRGKVCCTSSERERLEKIIDIGFVDCGLKFSANKPSYTWWNYMRNSVARNMGLRLDYFLASKGVSIKSYEVAIDMRLKKQPSDHAPLVLEIQ
jgi:exodeoxyribonuclease-3